MEKKGIDLFINEKVSLFIKDFSRERDFDGNLKTKINRKDGVMKSYDDLNYYIEAYYGINKGKVIAILKSSVMRIEPILENSRGGRYE